MHVVQIFPLDWKRLIWAYAVTYDTELKNGRVYWGGNRE